MSKIITIVVGKNRTESYNIMKGSKVLLITPKFGEYRVDEISMELTITTDVDTGELVTLEKDYVCIICNIDEMRFLFPLGRPGVFYRLPDVNTLPTTGDFEVID